MIIDFRNINGGGGEYILPTATATRLGGVKIGEGINVAADGTISVSGGGSDIVAYCINDLTQEQLAAIWAEYHTNLNIPTSYSITYRRQNGQASFDVIGIQALGSNSYVSFFYKQNGNEATLYTNSSLRLYEDGTYEEYKGGETYKATEVDKKLKAKQDTLVSGTNIKTVNGTSILGSGNIEIQGGGSSDYQAVDTMYDFDHPVVGSLAFVRTEPTEEVSFEHTEFKFDNWQTDNIVGMKFQVPYDYLNYSYSPASYHTSCSSLDFWFTEIHQFKFDTDGYLKFNNEGAWVMIEDLAKELGLEYEYTLGSRDAGQFGFLEYKVRIKNSPEDNGYIIEFYIDGVNEGYPYTLFTGSDGDRANAPLYKKVITKLIPENFKVFDGENWTLPNLVVNDFKVKGKGGANRNFFLNDMTADERVALYNEIHEKLNFPEQQGNGFVGNIYWLQGDKLVQMESIYHSLGASGDIVYMSGIIGLDARPYLVKLRLDSNGNIVDGGSGNLVNEDAFANRCGIGVTYNHESETFELQKNGDWTVLYHHIRYGNAQAPAFAIQMKFGEIGLAGTWGTSYCFAPATVSVWNDSETTSHAYWTVESTITKPDGNKFKLKVTSSDYWFNDNYTFSLTPIVETVVLTQAEYDALENKDTSNNLYYIID